MHERAPMIGRMVAAVGTIAALFAVVFAGTAAANNLDVRTAQSAAKQVAKQECQDTSGCTGYGASNIQRITQHKASGKIYVNSTKNGIKFQCRQQIVLKLDHSTGQIRFGTSSRKCVDLGPA
jgi:ABC-type phosphate transport system substrate-binding protein